MQHAPIPQPIRDRLAARIKSASIDRVSAAAGVHHSTLKKALAGAPVSPKIAGLLAMAASVTRQAAEFQVARETAIRYPRPRQPITSWDVQSIRSARDDQLLGWFQIPVRLAEASQTDDAIFNARSARIAPQDAISTRVVAAPGGQRLANRSAESIQIPKTVIKGIHGTLVDHGVAIGYVDWRSNSTGTQVDAVLSEWPLEFVRWNQSTSTLQTPIEMGSRPVDIMHGDGTWIVFKSFDQRPWIHGACVLPAAMIWAAHAEGLGDWSASSRAHGLAKVVGELGEGVVIRDDKGELTQDARDFLDLLLDVASGDSAAGIQPHGSKFDFLSNPSNAWEVFDRLTGNREKAAARVYLGTDAILGSVGGAPGVDIAALFGVATTKLQGDFATIERGLYTGLYQPWTAINTGDSRKSPRLEYLLPDPDADAKHEETAKNYDRLARIINGLRSQGMIVTQETVNNVATALSVSPIPQLAALPVTPPAPPTAPAPAAP